jgi:predicted RNA-binding protein YlqC (UPF0109 family)
MKDWIEKTMKRMVSQPDAVRLEQSEGEITVIFSAVVAGEDFHIFRGQGDRLLRSLNAAISLAGVKQRKRYLLKLKG